MGVKEQMKHNKLTRYSLRFLLLLTAMVAMLVAHVVNHNRRVSKAIWTLRSYGAQLESDPFREENRLIDKVYIHESYLVTIEAGSASISDAQSALKVLRDSFVYVTNDDSGEVTAILRNALSARTHVYNKLR